jgi:phage terminase large subunit-like protein
MARAEPIAAMYERGKVKHAPGLGELEQQMVTWEPLGAMGSPDRLDAMVWALTDLMLKGRINPEIQILYSKT